MVPSGAHNGSGALGGKASGLVFIKDLLAKEIDPASFSDIDINVPTMAVIATDCFDQFIAQNHLAKLPVEEMPDDRIAHAFQKGDLPVELLGDLRALIVQVKTPWRSAPPACWRTHWSVRLPASTPPK